MPYTHRGEPVAGNRTDNRRLMKETVDRIRTFTGMGATAPYTENRRRKNMGIFR